MLARYSLSMRCCSSSTRSRRRSCALRYASEVTAACWDAITRSVRSRSSFWAMIISICRRALVSERPVGGAACCKPPIPPEDAASRSGSPHGQAPCGTVVGTASEGVARGRQQERASTDAVDLGFHVVDLGLDDALVRQDGPKIEDWKRQDDCVCLFGVADGRKVFVCRPAQVLDFGGEPCLAVHESQPQQSLTPQLDRRPQDELHGDCFGASIRRRLRQRRREGVPHDPLPNHVHYL